MGWAILIFTLLVRLYLFYREWRRSGSSLLFFHGETIFPLFRYSPTAGCKNPLVVDNSPLYSLYGLLIALLFYGALAVFFIDSSWIGLGLVAFSCNLIAFVSFEAQNRRLRLLNQTLAFLEEGSTLYEEAIKKAKENATKAQLQSDKCIQDEETGVSKMKQTNNQKEETEKKIEAENAQSDTVVTDSITAHNPLLFLTDLFDSPKGSINAHSHADLDVDEKFHLNENDLKLLELEAPTLDNAEEIEKLANQLYSSAPSLDWLVCGQSHNPDKELIQWKTSQNTSKLTRDRWLLLLIKLSYSSAVAFHSQSKYSVHFLIELMRFAEGVRGEQERLICQMLIDTGLQGISMDKIRQIPHDSEERKNLEIALKVWLKKQKQLAEERKKKKEEEIRESKRREEEIRVQMEEEERKRLEDLKKIVQPSVVIDSAAQELARKKKEEEMKNLEKERKKREEERKAEEIARIKKKQEEEAVLIASQKEAELKAFREMQAEVERKEAEKRKKEEEMKRNEELKKQKELVDLSNARQQCTIALTGNQYVIQPWFECLTCKLTGGAGCCVICKDICHRGHEVRAASSSPSPFFCDCGTRKCIGLLSIQERNSLLEKNKPKDAELDQILLQCQATNKPFVDSNFPAGPSALHRDPKKPKHNDWANVQWKRPEELTGVNHPALFVEGFDPNDIRQGMLGDCWVLSAISVLTLNQTQLLDVFITRDHSQYGVYAVKFKKNGRERTVIVDSLVPTDARGNPIFAKSNDPNELWVIILEKAYAKLHGSYESIESGFVDDALKDLTGGVPGRIDMTKPEAKQDIRNGTLFKKLLQYRQSGYLLGAGSPSGSDSEASASPSGIVQVLH
jgi:hypothetical protein